MEPTRPRPVGLNRRPNPEADPPIEDREAGPWAVALPIVHSASLIRLWRRTEIRVLEDRESGRLWLRGDHHDEALDGLLRALLGAHRYRVRPDDQLVPQGRRVPQGLLPQGDWIPLREHVRLQAPESSAPPTVEDRAAFRLVRDSRPREATLMALLFDTWSTYALSAPEVRLEPLRFAVEPGGLCVLWGTPLPPIPGKLYAEADRLAVPLGWAWRPRLQPGLVRTLLELVPEELAILDPDGPAEVLEEADFVPATRASIRLTGRRLRTNPDPADGDRTVFAPEEPTDDD